MINPSVFADKLGLLKSWFQRELEEPVEQALYMGLSSKITTEEFVAACDRIFSEEKGFPGNFPCVKDFIDKSRGSLDEMAGGEWTTILGQVSKGNHRPEMSVAAKNAVAQIGGMESIRMANVADIRWMRRDFLDAYRSTPLADRYTPYTPALPPERTIRAISPSIN